MYTVVKKNKKPSKRKLIIYQGDEKICEVVPNWGWFSFTTYIEEELHYKLRPFIMQNLYWLIGNNQDYNQWQELIELFDSNVVNLHSLFCNEEEKQIALNSFNL